MTRLEKLRSKYNELLEKMRGIIDKADEEKRDLTDAETHDYEVFEAEADKIKAAVAKEERLSLAELEARRVIDDPLRPDPTRQRDDKKEFKSFGEFLYCVRYAPSDQRLIEMQKRAQSMGVGEAGGFAVPDTFVPTLLAVTPQDAIFRPRCTVIPAGDSPDSETTMPALDQGTGQNIYAGVTVAATSEGATLSETDAKLREVKLIPQETGAFITLSNKLLRNWAASSAVVSNLLRKALIGWEDTKVLLGSGVNEPLGITNAPCKKVATRATASQIAFADVATMYSYLKFGGSPIWVGSQTILPQLMTLRDAASSYIFVKDAVANVAGSLFGFPLFFNERAPALGTEGDLILCDPAYYLLKDGMGIAVSMSEHVNFTSNRTVIKAIFSVDGKPWLNTAIPLEGSSSNTISPFVTLA